MNKILGTYLNSLTKDWEMVTSGFNEMTNTSAYELLILSSLGILFGITVLLSITPFFQKELLNDPKIPDKFALFTKMQPHRTKVRQRNGRFIGFIRYGEPEYSFSWNPLYLYWYIFERYAWFFGLRVIGIPLLQTLFTYTLQKFKTRETVDDNGREMEEFTIDSRASDHVRTRPFTFPFIISGAEVQTVPFTIKGSAQVRITPDTEYNAFYNTDSWNIVLTQALTGVLRGVIRSEVTLDKIIGNVQKTLWGSDSSDKNSYNEVSQEIYKKLLEYTVTIDKTKFTLAEVASVEVLSVDITDFEPELNEKEMSEIRAAIKGRQLGRARALEGEGEGALQKSILATATKSGNHGQTSILAEAMVRASRNGNLDALAAAFLKKIVTGD